MRFFNKMIDLVTTLFCSVGPLKPIGNWWWRKRLGAVHENLPMESYLSRSQVMQTMS